MPRVNIKEKDPVHYAKVKAEQDELSKQCSSKMTMARICPYCQHIIPVRVLQPRCVLCRPFPA